MDKPSPIEQIITGLTPTTPIGREKPNLHRQKLILDLLSTFFSTNTYLTAQGKIRNFPKSWGRWRKPHNEALELNPLVLVMIYGEMYGSIPMDLEDSLYGLNGVFKKSAKTVIIPPAHEFFTDNEHLRYL